MILEYLEDMRTRPRHVRQRFAFVVAVSVSVAVAAIWVFTLPAKFSSIAESTSFDTIPATQELQASLGESTESLQEAIGMSELMRGLDEQNGKAPQVEESTTIITSTTTPTLPPFVLGTSTPASTSSAPVSTTTSPQTTGVVEENN